MGVFTAPLERLAALRHRRAQTHAFEPVHPPIQDVADNARRLRRLFVSLPKGTSYVRSVGVATAYDQMLALACEMLEVPNRLLAIPHSKQRELERLRVEFELGEVGLLL